MARLTSDPRAWVEVADGVSGEIVVRLWGEIDLANAESLWPTISRAVERAPELLVFDLAELSFMDSSGIALLLRAAAEVPAVQVRNASPMIRRTLEITGLHEILGMMP